MNQYAFLMDYCTCTKTSRVLAIWGQCSIFVPPKKIRKIELSRPIFSGGKEIKHWTELSCCKINRSSNQIMGIVQSKSNGPLSWQFIYLNKVALTAIVIMALHHNFCTWDTDLLCATKVYKLPWSKPLWC